MGEILLALGFVEDFQELSISESEKHPIGVFLSQIAGKTEVSTQIISPHLFDLNPENYSPLKYLFRFAVMNRLRI